MSSHLSCLLMPIFMMSKIDIVYKSHALFALCSIVSEVVHKGYSTRPKRQRYANSCRQMRTVTGRQMPLPDPVSALYFLPTCSPGGYLLVELLFLFLFPWR